MSELSDLNPTAEELLTLRRERERLEYKMSQYRPFSDEYNLARYNRDFGGHWFDPESKRFFRSRVGAIMHGDTPDTWNIFISSERFVDSRGNSERRYYTIRRLTRDGSVVNISEFQQYASASGAKRAAARFIRTGSL
jgi:hypothetical protein